MKTLITMVLLCLGCASAAYAQVGKDGDVTISSTTNINSTATNLSANAAAGATSLQVKNGGGFAVGDLIMVYQAQGATVRTNTNDESFGEVTDMGNAGAYEFVEVAGVSGNTITLATGLDRSYTYQHNINGQNFDDLVQVIKVPRYETLTVSAGGTITPDAWDGSTGGVVVMEVNGDMQLDGLIDVEGKGFRGGQAVTDREFGINGRVESFRSNDERDGGRKGEGIAGYSEEYRRMGGEYGRGAVANGGGGGNGHNSGGGGGANAFNMTNTAWNGLGNPDPAYDDYWDVEIAYGNATATPGGIAGNMSSGGGRGGYSWAAKDADPLVGPSHNDWRLYNSADWRDNIGGFGGRPIVAEPGRAYFGGGGGVGSHDNAHTRDGGDGGGLVIILSNGKVVGTGTINAGGADGENDQPAFNGNNSADAASGAGAGGSVIIKSTLGVDTNIDIDVSGGAGGNQNFPFAEAEGPGGGGGGGYIAAFNTLPTNGITETLDGGEAGITTTTFPMLGSRFPVNGATGGASGSTASFEMQPDQEACLDETIELTLPADVLALVGTDVKWYEDVTGGTALPGTGSPWTSPALDVAGTKTFYYSSGTNGVDVRFPIVVEVHDKPDVTADKATVCPGQPATITAAGGDTYLWETAETTASIDVSPSVETQYIVTGTNTFGCSDTAIATVRMGSGVGFTAPADEEICEGDNVTLTVGGTDSYDWSPADGLDVTTGTSVVASPDATTTYTITGGDPGCEVSVTVTVTVNPSPVVSITGNTDICPGETTALSATGADTYLWSPSGSLDATDQADVVADPTATTTYTVQGTSLAGCVHDTTIEVTVHELPDLSVTDPTPVCQPLTIDITTVWTDDNANTAGGGTVGYFSDLDLTAVVPDPTAIATNGTYYIGKVSAEGCPDAVPVTVVLYPEITVDASPDVICEGDMATIVAEGASTYVWAGDAEAAAQTTGTINVSPATTTQYMVTGTDDNGCTNTSTVDVTVNPLPNVTATDATICEGRPVTLAAAGATTYSWFDDQNQPVQETLSPTTTTTYTVIGVDDNQCENMATATVTVNPLPVLDVTPESSICVGATADLSASGADTYNWSPSTGLDVVTGPDVVASPPSTTQYTVIGTLNGCTNSATITLNVVDAPDLAVSPDVTICIGESAELVASLASSYSWTPNQDISATNTAKVTVTPTTTTTYTVEGVTNGCVGDPLTLDVTVTVNPLPVVGLQGGEICESSSIVLTATGDATSFTWSPTASLSASTGTSVTASPTTATEYTVVGSLLGCVDSAKATVLVNPAPSLKVDGATICEGQSATLNVSGALTYTWTPAASLDIDTGDEVIASPTTTQIYTITGVDANSCQGTRQVTVEVIPNVVPDISDSVTICAGETVQLAASGGTDYRWSTAETTTIIRVSPIVNSVYYVDISNGYCSATDSVHVYVRNPGGLGVYAPNSFTPNGDGINEVFQIITDVELISTFNAAVFDRWGDLIHTWDDPRDGWDGDYKGEPAKKDVYVYTVEVTDLCQQMYTSMGRVTVSK